MYIQPAAFQTTSFQPTGLDLCRRQSGLNIHEIRKKITERTGEKTPKDTDTIIRRAAELGIIRPGRGFVIGEG